MTAPAETADELFRRLYVCGDPNCAASHVDPASLPDRAVFVEGAP